MICKTAVKSDVAKVRTLIVGEAGDLAAPPGSKLWAIAVRLQIQSLLKDNASSVKHLQTWIKGIEEYAGYRQLTDENGQPFRSYAAFCKAKSPWGLGYPPEIIAQVLKELESAQAPLLEVENDQIKNSGSSSKYLQKFSKLVQACPDGKPVNFAKIEEVLDCPRSTAQLWRKRWLDLGWIEPSTTGGRGYYQIAEEGRKIVREWLEKMSSGTINGELWLTIPRYNSKKAAQKLIKSLEVDQLRELYNLIGESLNQ